MINFPCFTNICQSQTDIFEDSKKQQQAAQYSVLMCTDVYSAIVTFLAVVVIHDAIADKWRLGLDSVRAVGYRSHSMRQLYDSCRIVCGRLYTPLQKTPYAPPTKASHVYAEQGDMSTVQDTVCSTSSPCPPINIKPNFSYTILMSRCPQS